MTKTLLLAAVTALTAIPAIAQTQPAPAEKSEGGPNPNEMVCRRVHDSGSRLAASRVCMTRQQWVDYQRQQRQDTEVSQQRRVAPRG